VSPFIDDQVAHLDALTVCRFDDGSSTTSQQRFDSILELAGTERLREIIVGAGLKACHLVCECIECS
jgi:hypothetical protein